MIHRDRNGKSLASWFRHWLAGTAVALFVPVAGQSVAASDCGMDTLVAVPSVVIESTTGQSGASDPLCEKVARRGTLRPVALPPQLRAAESRYELEYAEPMPAAELTFVVAHDVPQPPRQTRRFTVQLAEQFSPEQLPPSEGEPEDKSDDDSWLDIRPKSLANPSELNEGPRPKDISGMRDPDGVPRAVQLYEARLQRKDLCASSRFYHRPLYFEDQKLERYGASPGMLGRMPPVRSGVHFFGSVVLLPAKMVRTPPHHYVPTPCVCGCR